MGVGEDFVCKEIGSENDLDVKKLVEELKIKYKSTWWDSKIEFPSLDKKYTIKEKKINEKELEKFIEILLEEINNIPEHEDDFKIWSDKIIKFTKNFFENTLGLRKELLNIIFSEGYSTVTNDFIKKVKSFSKDINIYDMFQAIRNVWIMNSIQLFLDYEVELTPSIFAYSMLYPYTDNYLDDKKITIEEKTNFNSRFRNRLEGKNVEPLNNHEKDIYELVKMIEIQFPREECPNVYEGLLSIHTGQEKSLFQQKNISFPFEKDILGISFEKGGTSVIADGFLINPFMTKVQIDFMFGYGVFLQLADDLQDIKDDLDNKHMTIFSQLANKWTLDKATNRLFWFMKDILESGDYFKTTKLDDLKELIETSCKYLIFEAIAENKRFYTKNYIKRIEEYYRFRFSYQKKLRRKIKKKFKKIDTERILKILEKNLE